MKKSGFSFHFKNFFILIMLVLFTLISSSVATVMPIIGRIIHIDSKVSYLLSALLLILILVTGILVAKKLKLQRTHRLLTKKNVILMIVSYVMIQTVNYVCIYLQSNLASARDATTFLSEFNEIPGVLLLLSATIVTPILEEIVFRGFIIGYWFKDQPIMGIIISSIMFAMCHLKENIFIILMYVFSSAIYGFVYVKSEKIQASIILHILNNLPYGISVL